MKQIIQDLKTGVTKLEDVPSPGIRPGHLLIRTRSSLLSSGTERMLLELGKTSLIEKAWQQPDKIRQVFERVRTDGLLPTIEAIKGRLDFSLPLGYCNAGVVMEIGAGVTGFARGDRVASNGHHAEVVCVPRNLCAKIPDDVSDEAAAFTVIGAIGLQGIRLALPTLGETFAVTGLGLIGLMTVQLLRAQGCRVLGIDLDPQRLAVARQFGAETVNIGDGQDPVAAAMDLSRGVGLDGVIITAATDSNEPVHQAAQMCRKRGRIVLVGVTGLEISRADFYEKELSFQVSCSYGPGRYDPAYEDKGQDYPVGYVRWTEQRNFEAILDMLASRQVDVKPLIAHRFELDEAEQAYRTLMNEAAALGILFEYPGTEVRSEQVVRDQTVPLNGAHKDSARQRAVVAFIGAGNYASAALIPAFARTNARLKLVASRTGVSGRHVGKKFGFEETTTETDRVFTDGEINTVVIATRHDSHARLVCAALEAGKHVFVEKPLAIDPAGLEDIKQTCAAVAARGSAPLLMVGFNRRFAPQIVKIRSLLEQVKEPKVFVMTVNAGMIPESHWTQDPTVGGGRIIGEACHFIDLLRFLAGAPVTGLSASAIGRTAGSAKVDDKVSFTLKFADGSLGTVHYLANGHKSFPKERLEIFCAGRILQLDNFRRLTAYGWPGFAPMRLWRQDKGNNDCAAAFVQAIENGVGAPIPIEEIIEVTAVSFQIEEQVRA